MEALFASLVSKYGFEIAAKMLGLDQQTQNPKYAISLGGLTLDPANMAKRAILNTGIRSAIGGQLSGLLAPAAMMGGAFFLGQRYNPLNPKAVNYNPNLQQEINFAANRGYISNNPGSGLMQYSPDSVLAGQNVVSMFGTNSYIGQLEKKKDYFEDRLEKGKSINESKYAQTLNEISEAKGFTQDKARTKNYGPYSGGGGNNNGGGGGNISGSVSRGGTDDTPGTPFRRGGIASL
jgi:hypothetical protein